MPSHIESSREADLRSRATARIKGHHLDIRRASASQALGVLFQLASSPSTAQDALALLHELQVHQVELELQDEELRSSRNELEEALSRHIVLYDCAPIGYFTIDAGTVIHELNLRGASLLGVEREDLLGRPLDCFLTDRSADRLHALMAQVRQAHQSDSCELELTVQCGERRGVRASATKDPLDSRFLLVLTESAARGI